MDKLEILLAIETSKRDALQQQSPDNDQAQELLARVVARVNLINSAHATSDTARQEALGRLRELTERLARFRQGELYTSTVKAVEDLPDGKTAKQLRDSTGQPLKDPPVPGIHTYREYVDALEDARKAASDATWEFITCEAETQAAQRWLAVLGPLANQTAELITRWVAVGVERGVEQARRFKQLPPDLQGPHTYNVSAWWAVEQARWEERRFGELAKPMIDAEVDRLAKARIRLAEAMNRQMVAERKLRSTVTAVQEAAANLQIAERMVLERLVSGAGPLPDDAGKVEE